MESESDSDGEDLGMIRTGLIEELRNVLEEYPDDGQILKEMIQNAEDAGARTINIIADKRQLNVVEDARSMKKHPHLKYFKGPALCVHNDALFSDDDWKGIRMLHASIKADDPLKVGRFGLGFKSVFHLTDRLVIVSGKYIMYMDPFKGEERYCKFKTLSRKDGVEKRSIYQCLDGVFGFTKQVLENGYYPGTLFWFPLRQEASELSGTEYSDAKMEELLYAFAAEAKTMLLFLKSIEQIHVYRRENSQMPQESFTVGIAASCLQHVKEKRTEFLQGIKTKKNTLPTHTVSCAIEITIETRDRLTLRSLATSQQWLVVNLHAGTKDMSKKLQELCLNPKLSYRPHVGVAYPLNHQEHFQSQLFCFLPLPLDTRSPTGLPVHVNGYFALSQNRRHIKWPTADQLSRKVTLEPKLQWNCYLTNEVLPNAYIVLLKRLKELFSHNPNQFYAAWPDCESVADKWQPVVQPLYRYLTTANSFYTEANGGSWIPLNRCILQYILPGSTEHLNKVVERLYQLTNQNLIKLPDYIESNLKILGHLSQVQRTTPQHVSGLIPQCLPYLSKSEKLLLLEYLCRDSSADQLLLDQDLIHLEDDTFGRFSHLRNRNTQTVYYCKESSSIELFPGLKKRFCSRTLKTEIGKCLQHIAELGTYSLQMLRKADILYLLQESMQITFGTGRYIVPENDAWIKAVWKYLSNTDLSPFCHLQLLPSVDGNKLMLLPLKGIYILSSAPGHNQMEPDLSSCLRKLGITVVSSLPSYVIHHSQILGDYVQYPNTPGVLSALQQIGQDSSTKQTAVSTFNRSASAAEKEALLRFIHSYSFVIHVNVRSLLWCLQLFHEIETQKYVSLQDVSRVAPKPLPPVKLSSLLDCNNIQRQVAVQLDATEISLEELVSSTLCDMLESYHCFSTSEIMKFMLFSLTQKELMKNTSLMSLARKLPFVLTSSGTLKTPNDLYSPSKLLEDLFLGEDKFPTGEFGSEKIIQKLKSLGLRNEGNLLPNDVYISACMISQQSSTAAGQKKALALWNLIVKFGDSFSKSTLESISSIQCLPCLQNKPRDYPSSLPLKITPTLSKPEMMCLYSSITLAGSVMQALGPDMPSKSVLNYLNVESRLDHQVVLNHLANIVKHFSPNEAAQYRIILSEVYRYLNNNICKNITDSLKQDKCILVDSDGLFDAPDQFWVNRRGTDISLSPYRHPLPAELTVIKDLILGCGGRQTQDTGMLLGVLADIQVKYLQGQANGIEYQQDMRLVLHILDVLKRDSESVRGEVLLPIVCDQPNTLCFKKAKHCTIGTGSEVGNLLAASDGGGKDIIYVHSEVNKDTASALGALHLKARALTGVETLDYKYGQREDLTKRLHGLLNESYTDGFSVPKELIQNADDAGAITVKFLLDERENEDAKSSLISDGLASLQGPALWAFNDALFTDEDFDNIIQLGGATKQDDASKVGKFGLGFNSVYNLTDVPSFLSRHIMAIFDPQKTYLEDGAGLKLDFKKPVNLALLTRMPNQFKPYQNVFGCNLKKDGNEVYFNGTLFRFPFRTKHQANCSKLKNESYTDIKRKDFLTMLMERAGNLLLFTQNVNAIEIWYLADKTTDPKEASCVLRVSKSFKREMIVPQSSLSGSILQYFKQHWPASLDIQIKEDVCINMEVTKTANNICGVSSFESTAHFKIAWTSGTKSAKMAKKYSRGLVALAAAAVPLQENLILPLKHCPNGFYKSGHVFCFLPLPVQISLPVHINGTFLLTSSRRGLRIKTEDDIHSVEAEWNSTVFSDAVCRAYLLLLECLSRSLKATADLTSYFDLWPTKENQPILFESFYEHLVNSQRKILPSPGKGLWVSFSEAQFLDPLMRKSESGQIAFDALNYFWHEKSHLVDIPYSVSQQLRSSKQSKEFEKKIVTKVYFYKNVFFPNIQDDYWEKTKRDRLTEHALTQDNIEIKKLLQNYACIPCTDCNILRCPHELIHPDKAPAKLYQPAEGHFPQKAGKDTDSDEDLVNFCSATCLQNLVQLGMVADDLPWEKLVERAQTVVSLYAQDKELALNRSFCLIEYLSTNSGNRFRYNLCPNEIMKVLSETCFLPVLVKPEDWPFPWAGSKVELAAPCELCSSTLKELVACESKLLDLKRFKSAGSFSSGKKEVLQKLGVVMEETFDSSNVLSYVIKQMRSVAESYQNNSSNSKVTHSICQNVYNYINKCLSLTNKEEIKTSIVQSLSDREIVWTGNNFVLPDRVALTVEFDCSPYLFQLDKGLQNFKSFFELIGVRKEFVTKDAVAVLQKINEENAGQELSEQNISLVSRVAQLLCSAAKKDNKQPLDTLQIYLPARDGHMLLVNNLCLDDHTWKTDSKGMTFVHDSISSETAYILGVKTKKGRFHKDVTKPISCPFGQHEKLTNRIKRLLHGYTFDSSIFKELIQNADDAGATEIKFIKDWRSHGEKKIPDGWDKLQGPALCVYNNSSFNANDIKAIQDLGMGSKSDDLVKIGQYGVGFNAVYNITDVPSFWTRMSDNQEVICVFDPCCRYAEEATPETPGTMFVDLVQVREGYSDMMSGYVNDEIDMSQFGTLFRFPLRTSEMAAVSDIANAAVTQHQISRLLTQFSEEMNLCLLFLNNVHKLGIYTISEDGRIQTDYEVTKEIDPRCCQSVSYFQQHLVKLSDEIQANRLDLKNIPVFQDVCYSSISTAGGCKDDWLIVSRVGFANPTEVSPTLEKEWKEEHFRLLPVGGVAVRLSELVSKEQAHKSRNVELDGKLRNAEYLAFCMLPLPVKTSLPVHINGRFALDHETRRTLWEGTDDARTNWNELIAKEVIVPAFLIAVQDAKQKWFEQNCQQFSKSQFKKKHHQYQSLFPDPQKAPSSFWKTLITNFYVQITAQELQLFPVICNDADKILLEWVPVVKQDGFPGHFSNLVTHFKELSHPVSVKQNSVALPQYHGHINNENWPRKEADEMESLLKQINMKIVETPFHIYKYFKQAGIESVREVTPQSVVEFLKSAGQSKSTSCNISNLPQQVEDTPLLSVPNVKRVLRFVKSSPDFFTKLADLPLCLRQSNKLYFFKQVDEKEKPIMSKYCMLLPGSADSFLHHDIFGYFESFADSDAVKLVMKQLDIPTFSSMLPLTMPEDMYKMGNPCVFNTHSSSIPFPEWLKETWRFLEEECKKKNSKDEVKIPQTVIQENIRCLEEWSLLPVKKNGQQQESLYPLKDANRVVYLSTIKDSSNSQLWEILKSLPLAFLDSAHLPALSIARDIVASISNPVALLNALATLGNSLNLPQQQAQCVLEYFTSNLIQLNEMCREKEQVCKQLRELPFYVKINGNSVSLPNDSLILCLEDHIPEDGLQEWSEAVPFSVMLLVKKHIPQGLQKFLDFQSPSYVNFYCDYLLPTLRFLTPNNILTHITFIRDILNYLTMKEDSEKLTAVLKCTAFISCPDGFRKAGDFFCKDVEAFKVMLPSNKFLPPPFDNREWKPFMRNAGMICEISNAMFVDFARRLETEGHSGLTESLLKRSAVLVRHLFQNMKLKNNDILLTVKDIRFVRPLLMSDIEPYGRKLEVITQSFCQNRLVSYAECCLEKDLRLIWSSSCIVHSEADPYRMQIKQEVIKKVQAQLGLPQNAPLDKVMQHVKNVCWSLYGETGKGILESFQTGSDEILQQIMFDMYTFLNGNVGDGVELQQLKEMPIIFDINNKQMMKSENVVLELPQDFAIAGHIVKAPVEFGPFFRFFKLLGVAEQVTVNHYGRVLSHLFAAARNEPLHVEEMKIVIKAVKGVFCCLRDGCDEVKAFSLPILPLPAVDQRLMKSSDLVFKDDLSLSKRFQVEDSGIKFFIGFKELEYQVQDHIYEANLLPTEVRMTFLSKIVQEVIPEEIKSTAVDSQYAQDLREVLDDVGFHKALLRLVFDDFQKSGKPRSEDAAKNIIATLSNIHIREVTGLVTVLWWNDASVPESEFVKKCYVQTDDRIKQSAFIYVDTDACRHWSESCQIFWYSLAKAIQFVNGIHSDSFISLLMMVLQDPTNAENILNEAGISDLVQGIDSSSSAIPPPGTYIPVEHHCYLDNRFYKFDPGEHVGFELNDLEVEAGTDEDVSPTYIYAIVIEKVNESATGLTSLLSAQYCVNLGPERGKITVSAIHLYKFVRQTTSSTSTELVLLAENSASLENETFPDNIPEAEVLRDIREKLTEAWNLSEAGRKTVIKRLLLRWHPDKNKGNEKFCTRMTQQILKYVSILENGGTLNIDEDDDMNETIVPRNFTSSYSHFYQQMYERGRRHGQYYSSHHSSGGRGSNTFYNYNSYSRQRPNPQPGEARIWFRQAEADLNSAKAGRDTSNIGYNWMCYHCHQAIEKALRAVMFYRDANNCKHSHDLKHLAREVNDAEIKRLATEMENLVGSHRRMRYPDSVDGARIPADIYSQHDAEEACRIAETILQKARNLM